MTTPESCGLFYQSYFLSIAKISRLLGKSKLFIPFNITRKITLLDSSHSCNTYSFKNKSEVYDDVKGVIGFEIDVRILYKVQGHTFELTNGEVARYVGYDKIIEDAGKIPREGKDIVESYMDNNCNALFPWLIQIEGSSFSIYLTPDFTRPICTPPLASETVCQPRYLTSKITFAIFSLIS